MLYSLLEMHSLLNLKTYSDAQGGDGGPTLPNSEILLCGVGKPKLLRDIEKCVARTG